MYISEHVYIITVHKWFGIKIRIWNKFFLCWNLRNVTKPVIGPYMPFGPSEPLGGWGPWHFATKATLLLRLCVVHESHMGFGTVKPPLHNSSAWSILTLRITLLSPHIGLHYHPQPLLISLYHHWGIFILIICGKMVTAKPKEMSAEINQM